MTTILIADSSKPSVVMTSEIFKDRLPGVVVHVAGTAKEALEKLEEVNPDVCVIDFDLPDADGPALIENIKAQFMGPVFLTAYPDAIVQGAVQDNLFGWDDASSWISKPVNTKNFSPAIDKFLIEKRRLSRRFDSQLAAQLVAKAAGRGKRAPKVEGVVKNISISGVLFELLSPLKLKKDQEVTVHIDFFKEPEPKAKSASKAKGKKKAKTVTAKAKKTQATVPPIRASDAKIKAKVAWAQKDQMVGLEFAKMTEPQRKGLFECLKKYSSVDLIES